MDAMGLGMCLATPSITSHNICNSKFFHFMNEPKSKNKISPVCVNFCDVANVIARVEALSQH